GSASSTRCATDCGCGPGGTAARPRRSSTRRRYPPPTPCPDPAAAGMAPRERTASSGTSPWRGTACCAAASSPPPPPRTHTPLPAASIEDRDAAHRLLAALRGSFSTIRLVWADGGYPGRLLIWAKDVLTLTMHRRIVSRPRAKTGLGQPHRLRAHGRQPHRDGRDQPRRRHTAAPFLSHRESPSAR